MKNLRTSVLCVTILLCTASMQAQVQTAPLNEPNLNKPRLFSALPDKIQLNTAEMDGLLASPVGVPARLSLSPDNRFLFEGEVASTVNSNNNQLQTIVIRSTNFNGARLTISRIVGADGQIKYRGRILSFAHGDLYELENQNGQYQLVKKNFYDLVNE